MILGVRIIQDEIAPLTIDKRKTAIIIDDSLYSRALSKKVELLAKARNHIRSKFVNGFRILIMGWTDANIFIPLRFALLSSAKEENQICGIDQRIDKRTTGYRHRREALQKATELASIFVKEVMQ